MNTALISRLFVCCVLIACFQTGQAQQGRVMIANCEIMGSSGIERIFHTPHYYFGNPILKADRAWEMNAAGDPYAAPFSGGVWYDELLGKFRMWYSAGGNKKYGLITCYAESDDGRHWVKPALDVIPGTNIVDMTEHDCVSVLLDRHEEEKDKRYKMFIVAFNAPSSVSMLLKYSADGIHWSPPKALSGELYDRCAAYYDPFRKQYVLSLKTMNGKYRRSRSYLAHEDPAMAVSLAHRVYPPFEDKFIRYWFHADDADPRHPLYPQIRPQIYNHEAIAYENRMLGFFTVWQGPENSVCDSLQIQKRNEVLVGWSQDGFNWQRDNHTPFLPVGNPQDWNAGNVQSTCGSPLIVGDSLYFYVSGRYESKPVHDSNFAAGLAVMRRDGFASMKAGEKPGWFTTEQFLCTGNYLFVNVACNGELRAEILDEKGIPISGFTKEDCKALTMTDKTKQIIEWKSNMSISHLNGQYISLKFYMQNTDLFSYWVSNWLTGESQGYTAGGGPGLDPSGRDIPLPI